MKAPELLAPGGSFPAACQAFEAGADGVYLGLTEFSARAAAANFTLEQLRRIRGLAARLDRRIYVAINTVIRDDEMGRVASQLAWLEALQVDGVIVQDLGTCLLLACSFPRLAIHASTQMAIHNDSGLRFAEKLGIRRVILSRELPFQRISELRARHPGIELEVFIHGALCYSFSGICLASWGLTGRSANRGDCAQICRSLFRSDDEGTGRHQGTTPFSCRDLFLGTDVLKLAEIGIDALKIEGRMKSPEYVFHVTRLYREILNKGSALPEGELEELQKNVEATFSREKTRGFFASPRAEKLLTGRYPGHQGALLGAVRQVRDREIGLKLQCRLSLHDGIGYWVPGAREPVIFPVRRIMRTGRSVKFAEAGDAVSVRVPGDAPLPDRQTEVRLFSARFLDRHEVKETSVPAYRFPLELKAAMSPAGIVFSVDGVTGRFNFSRQLPIVSSTGGRPFAEVLRKHLGDPSESLFSIKDLVFENETGRAETEIFVPPSELKRTRKELFAALDNWFLLSVDARAKAAAAETFPAESLALPAELAHRDLLSPPAARPVPFASLPLLQAGAGSFAVIGKYTCIPLPPVMLDDDLWLQALRRLSKENSEALFAIGLNNVGHIDLAARLSDCGNLFFFIDFFLYAANRQALSLLSSRVARLLFAYAWVEGEAAVSPGVVSIARDFRPPLFYSLGCYERHAQGAGQCREECSKDLTHEMRQGRNTFTLVVRDCITYLFRREERHG